MNETIFSDAILDDRALAQADAAAVQHFVETGEPVDPIVRERVFARTARIRELIFQKHGYVDGSRFLLPATDEE